MRNSPWGSCCVSGKRQGEAVRAATSDGRQRGKSQPRVARARTGFRPPPRVEMTHQILVRQLRREIAVGAQRCGLALRVVLARSPGFLGALFAPSPLHTAY